MKEDVQLEILFFFSPFLREKAEAEQSAGKSAESTAFVCKRHKREKDKHARGSASRGLFFSPCIWLCCGMLRDVVGGGRGLGTNRQLDLVAGGERTNNEPRSKKVKKKRS